MRILLAFASLFVSLSLAAGSDTLNLMPMPASIQAGGGQLSLERSFSVAMSGYRDAALDRAVQRFLAQLSRQTGIPFSQKTGGVSNPTLTIRADHAREKVQKLGEDEAYELAVSGSGATLSAPNPLGILRGLQTFLQLVNITPSGFAVPELNIKDQPRFPWRGTLIDVGRHFIPLDVLKRNVDGLAAVKMNVLHWHLYDDQGFRIESKRFPKLQQDGSGGQYYTQDEIREFVAYAYERGVRIVPEFEMPGHSRSVLAGYPELGSGSGPYPVEPGAPDVAIDPTREETYKFIDKFIEEMSKLFPDEYVHIGGDEVNPEPWNANPKIQEFIRAHGMKNNQDLQAYFNQRVQKILDKHHKIMIGWDEVLHPELPKTVVVQSWRGQESLAAAARQGYRGLLSFGYYLDLMWPAARHYAGDPMSGDAANLTSEEKGRILGGESCMWSEWVTPENIDSRIWPRNAAIAERLWSPPEVQDPASMYRRLSSVSQSLEWLGLTQRSSLHPALERMSGGGDVKALGVLAGVVEPVKDYVRMDGVKGPWDFRAPLNHLIDIVRPESDQAREFAEMVQSYIAGGHQDARAAAEIRQRLITWRDNDARLHAELEGSFLLQELVPLSQNLSTLGSAGLFALDYLEKATPSPENWRSQQLAWIEQTKAPTANLLMMVTAPVQQLVEASGRERTQR
jgi:hexosaminidase